MFIAESELVKNISLANIWVMEQMDEIYDVGELVNLRPNAQRR